MEDRFLEDICFDKDFGRQMRFIAGPRQCGKTTLAKNFLAKHKSQDLYFNWDDKSIRRTFNNNWGHFKEIIRSQKIKQAWICFDEIHKTKNWKNLLKAHFDNYESLVKTIVTGSARLDLFRRSGDSLAGRYFLFHLMPLSLSELDSKLNLKEAKLSAKDFIEARLSRKLNLSTRKENLNSLLEFSGFPEPFYQAKKHFHKIWQKNYTERIIYEDLRDLSQIQDLDSVANLIELLPAVVSSTTSINALREDLELNHGTVKNYLKYLDLSYLCFSIKPYSKNLRHMIKKESKTYFYDWTRIPNEAARFENYIACELKTLTNFWNDSGQALCEIFYVKQKNQKETDFLIVKDKKPWLLIEVKLSNQNIESHHYNFSKHLGNIPIIQLIKECNTVEEKHPNAYIISADRFL